MNNEVMAVLDLARSLHARGEIVSSLKDGLKVTKDGLCWDLGTGLNPPLPARAERGQKLPVATPVILVLLGGERQHMDEGVGVIEDVASRYSLNVKFINPDDGEFLIRKKLPFGARH
ncbi:MAG: hypothetical protein ABSA41_14730 [Terriglobia bacterium]|jgi:hypothetical protein